MTNLAGYKNFDYLRYGFNNMQQNSTHGWHIHGRNYTGVYYLQFDGSAKTQIWNNEVINLNCEEGDIVMFVIYDTQSTVQNSNTKTIISFNLEI